MTRSRHDLGNGGSPGSSDAPAVGSGAHGAQHADPLAEVVSTLDQRFRQQVERALSVTLDGSVESLAFVDHYLSLATDEDREPILSLLASGAGAYFGELVRSRFGGAWIGRPHDPRSLRLVLAPAFLYFAPLDLAFAAIVRRDLDDADPRLPAGEPLDLAFHLRPRMVAQDGLDPERSPEIRALHDDASWMEDRLAELSPVPESDFHSLTFRYETLALIVEMLATKHAAAGKQPKTYTLSDYVRALAGERDRSA